MNEKCAACIHCEVCGLIKSEVAKDGACDFYEDGKRWEPCEDAISRQAVLDALCDGCELFKNGEQSCFAKCEEYHFLATLPPVTPQPKTDVLDKIRTEIETKYGQCDICEYFENYDYEENDISEYRPMGNIADILQIIDKHKAESEETETWNGIHAQITAPKGTFERIFNDADDDNDI